MISSKFHLLQISTCPVRDFWAAQQLPGFWSIKGLLSSWYLSWPLLVAVVMDVHGPFPGEVAPTSSRWKWLDLCTTVCLKTGYPSKGPIENGKIMIFGLHYIKFIETWGIPWYTLFSDTPISPFASHQRFGEWQLLEEADVFTVWRLLVRRVFYVLDVSQLEYPWGREDCHRSSIFFIRLLNNLKFDSMLPLGKKKDVKIIRPCWLDDPLTMEGVCRWLYLPKGPGSFQWLPVNPQISPILHCVASFSHDAWRGS